MLAAWSVSPPTRGWTFKAKQTITAGFGFPAHAGMDRGTHTTCTASGRFPRPRGDGPCWQHFRDHPAPVSPPTRGWTPVRSGGESRLVGFPAHAGMDPDGADVYTTSARFPRPRGDGPSLCVSFWRPFQVSPPTRGWTRVLVLVHRDEQGFPAHAGMDP